MGGFAQVGLVLQVVTESVRLIDRANAPIFGIGKNGLVNEWNRMAAKITGWTKEDVMGKNLLEFVIDDNE